MTEISTFLKQFTTLSRAPGRTWTEATKHKAPHKPILLLAVLDLVHRGIITAPFIDVTADLVELNEDPWGQPWVRRLKPARDSG